MENRFSFLEWKIAFFGMENIPHPSISLLLQWFVVAKNFYFGKLTIVGNIAPNFHSFKAFPIAIC
jgi:predicted membrane-bound dolichyl-phosphate-mannose-protein mannosyltransferase